MSYEELINLENIAQSSFSPCLISNAEIVARVLFSPKHYNNGEITTNALEQIFDPHGMSVLRINYEFDNSLARTIELLQKDDINKYAGYACASVQKIREILTSNGLRLYYVLDTATEDRVGHADVFAVRHEAVGLPKKAHNMYIKLQITELFNEVVEAS